MISSLPVATTQLSHGTSTLPPEALSQERHWLRTADEKPARKSGSEPERALPAAVPRRAPVTSKLALQNAGPDPSPIHWDPHPLADTIVSLCHAGPLPGLPVE